MRLCERSWHPRGCACVDGLQVTPAPQIKNAYDTAAAYFRSGATRSYEWRVGQLNAARRMVMENLEKMNSALTADLNKPKCVVWVQGGCATWAHAAARGV